MCTPELVNLANQLAGTLEDTTKKKTTKILNLQLQHMEAPKYNTRRKAPELCYYCKARTLEKRLLQKTEKTFHQLQLRNMLSV